MRPRGTWCGLVVAGGIAVSGAMTPVAGHFYQVKDPATGVVFITNAPTAAAARLIVREQPRPLPVSVLSPSRLPPDVATKGFDPLIREIAKVYDVEYALVKAVIKAESGFNHRAVSRKGAQGLMQLMPGTAAQHGVRDAFRPRDNIEGGVRHLKWLLDRYGGNVPYAVAAYNAGHARVEEARGVPNIAETREYLSRVMRYRENYRRERPNVDRNSSGVLFVTANQR